MASLQSTASGAPNVSALTVATRLASQRATCSAGDGVRVTGGRVVAANFYSHMEGYARQAGTTGGMGRTYIEVTRLDDAPKTAGTLRWAVGEAQKEGGGWIGFSRKLNAGDEVALTKGLRVNQNVTIDGGCIAPLITAPTWSSVIYVQRTSNVVLARIRISQSGPARSGKAGGDCVTVSHGTDKVWIGFSEFFRCTDGLIDITQSGIDAIMRATVSYNYLHDHDKAMLISGDHCADTETPCAKVEPTQGSVAQPMVRVTLQGNIFRSTGQRHPRVSGHAYVHVINDVVLYGARKRIDGSLGATYGAYAANGGMIFAEDSLYMPLTGTALKPAVSAQVGDTEVSGRGAVNVRGMAAAATNGIGNSKEVPMPSYAIHNGADFSSNPVSAAACVAGQAGIGGWERQTVSPCR